MVGDLDRAISELSLAIAGDGRNVDALFERAEVYFEAGSMELAHLDLTRIISSGCDFVTERVARGFAMLTEARATEALDILDQTLSAAPQDSHVRLARGRVLAFQGKTEDAKREFLAARLSAPTILIAARASRALAQLDRLRRN